MMTLTRSDLDVNRECALSNFTFTVPCAQHGG